MNKTVIARREKKIMNKTVTARIEKKIFFELSVIKDGFSLAIFN